MTSALRRLADLVVIVRLPSCLAGAASVLLGIHLAAGLSATDGWRIICASAGIACAVALANVVNDIRDVDVDILTKPGRPLPSKRMSVPFAYALAAVLTVLAVGSAVPLGGWTALWMVGLIALAIAYSVRFKNTVLVGNAVVALCASVPISYGAVISRAMHASVWVATLLAFLFMLSYETLKAISDRDGDARGGLHTFATTRGEVAAARLLLALVTVLTVILLAAVPVSTRPVAYLIVVVFTAIVPSWIAIILVRTRTRASGFERPVFAMRLAWCLGIVGLWLLR